jgi:hypothetical protein
MLRRLTTQEDCRNKPVTVRIVRVWFVVKAMLNDRMGLFDSRPIPGMSGDTLVGSFRAQRSSVKSVHHNAFLELEFSIDSGLSVILRRLLVQPMHVSNQYILTPWGRRVHLPKNNTKIKQTNRGPRLPTHSDAQGQNQAVNHLKPAFLGHFGSPEIYMLLKASAQGAAALVSTWTLQTSPPPP